MQEHDKEVFTLKGVINDARWSVMRDHIAYLMSVGLDNYTNMAYTYTNNTAFEDWRQCNVEQHPAVEAFRREYREVYYALMNYFKMQAVWHILDRRRDVAIQLENSND